MCVCHVKSLFIQWLTMLLNCVIIHYNNLNVKDLKMMTEIKTTVKTLIRKVYDSLPKDQVDDLCNDVVTYMIQHQCDHVHAIQNIYAKDD